MVTIQSGQLSAKQVYSPAYFSLTDSRVKVQVATATAPPPSKPLWNQIRELVRGGFVESDMTAVLHGSDEIQVSLSSELTLTSQLLQTPSPLRYEMLAQAARDIQLQLSYLHAHGIYVWALSGEDVYCQESDGGQLRYLLLTSRLSLGVGSRVSLASLFESLVGPCYACTKLSSYVHRLSAYSDALWV